MKRITLALLGIVALSACATQPAQNAASKVPGKTAVAAPEQPNPMDMAKASAAKNDMYSALKQYSEILKKEPNNPEALLGAADALLSTQNYEAAANTFEKVIHDAQHGLAAQEGLALSQLALGNQARAEQLFITVNKSNPQRWRSLNGLGMLADLKGDYAQAMSWYELALASAGTEAVIYNNYGFSRLMARQFPHAETLLNRALQLGGDNEALRNNLMQAIAWQGDYERSLRAKGDIPHYVALNNIGYIALLRDDKDTATRYFQQAIDQSPVWYALAFSNLEKARSMPAAGR